MFCKDMALCVCFYAPCVPRLLFNPAFNSVVLLSDFGSFTSPVLSGLFRLCFAWTYLLLVSLVKSSCLACYLRFGFFFCLFSFQLCCRYSGPGPFILFNKEWLCPPHQTFINWISSFLFADVLFNSFISLQTKSIKIIPDLMYFMFHMYFYCISVMINDNKRVWISHVFCVPRVFLLYFSND